MNKPRCAQVILVSFIETEARVRICGFACDEVNGP